MGPGLASLAGDLGWALRAAFDAPASVAGRLRRVRRLFLDVRLVRRSGLFDAADYRDTYRTALSPQVDPLHDFLKDGWRRGRQPNPLFDTTWYLQRYPDVTAAGHNPLVHFLRLGAAEDRNPNPYFDTGWYVSNDPALRGSGNPLVHYIRHGAAEGRAPSPRFDPGWYAATYPEATAMGLPPLVHFLRHGRKQGARPAARAQEVRSALDAEIVCLQQPSAMAGREVALLAAFCPGGVLKPHVRPYVDILHACGIAVVLIAGTDSPASPIGEELRSKLAGLYVRRNAGLDFAAWAHVLALEPGIYDASRLYLCNDSVLPGRHADRLKAALDRGRACGADVFGLTESLARGWHLQSYFIGFNPKALASNALQSFFAAVGILDDKERIIERYEVGLSAKLRGGGLSCAAVFPGATADNATISRWRELLDEDFPFVKVRTLAGDFVQAELKGWPAILEANGFDAALAQRVVDAGSAPMPHADRQLLAHGFPASPPQARTMPPKVAFIGPWTYASGLGVASRGYVSALQRVNAVVNLHPIKAPFHVHKRVAPAFDVCSFSGEADVAIVHLNPDAWSLLDAEQRRLISRARVRVGLWVWEMAALPPAWREQLDRVDEIWVPSRYCATAFEASGRRVRIVPHVVPLPPREAPPPGSRTILYVFDGASYPGWKNPHALVRAFCAARLAERGWRLVLKTKNLLDRQAEGRELMTLAGAAPGAILIDADYDAARMDALLAEADIYASSHRAEGFGLTLAEAMAAGKLVVATDYGGTRDLLDSDCGFPVPAQIRAADQSHGHYPQGGIWADVDEAALAAALRQAADRVEAGDWTLGECARARIGRDLSASAVARIMDGAIHELAAMSMAVQ